MRGGIGFLPFRSSSSRVMLLVLGVTLVASIALCVLAWRLTILDRTVQQQRAGERLEQAADSGSSALLQHVARTGEQLRIALETSPAGRESALAELVGRGNESTAVLLEGRTFKLVPNRRLRYLPEAPSRATVPDAVFAAGEVLEYGRRDYDAAARWFRELAIRSQDSVRAGALLRAARNDLRRKQTAQALAAYAELARLGSTVIDDEPAELVGRHARLALLPKQTRADYATSLMRDLQSGRWPLSRTSYEYYTTELARFTELEAAAPLWEESMDALVSMSRQAGMESGERVVWVRSGPPVLLIWRSRAGSVAGLALTGKHVEDRWLTGAPGFAFGLETADRRTLIPLQPGEKRAQRILSFADAHWRLIAAPTALPAETGNRQSLLVIGLSLVIVLVLTGSYAVVRAVSRELAVARLQTDFVSAVSHEFRSPLTTLRSMSEMLERGRVPTEERKQRYYGLMARETTRLHRLVEDLLDFGRMEAGAKQYELLPVDLASLVPEVVSAFQEEHAASGFEIAPGEIQAPSVLADAEALRRALHNLLENAVKYSADSRNIRIDVRQEGSHVCISVRDHGMGISPGDLKRIFRKFERGAAAEASSIQGTGLGLAMVHAIMRAHGGSICVESELNRGSTFTMSLPSAGAEEQKIAWHASS